MALPENNFQAERVLKSLDEQHGKYKFMEANMIARKRRLRQQLPDLQKSLEMIKILKDQEEDELQTNILLSEQVFVKSVIQKTQTVCLWLGANVMLEYPLDEAEELLKQNLDSASLNLRCLEHDQVSSNHFPTRIPPLILSESSRSSCETNKPPSRSPWLASTTGTSHEENNRNEAPHLIP
jgi:prefoldin subunit 5